MTSYENDVIDRCLRCHTGLEGSVSKSCLGIASSKKSSKTCDNMKVGNVLLLKAEKLGLSTVFFFPLKKGTDNTIIHIKRI